jgi:hypothetical protein
VKRTVEASGAFHAPYGEQIDHLFSARKMAMTMVIPATTVHDSKKSATARETLDRRTNQTAPAITVRAAQIGPTHMKSRSTPYQNGLRFSIISPAHGTMTGMEMKEHYTIVLIDTDRLRAKRRELAQAVRQAP